MAARCCIKLWHPDPGKPILYVGYHGSLEEDWRKACQFFSLSTAQNSGGCSIPAGYTKMIILTETLKEK